ncbi:glycosyltransferase [Blautia sp.]|uniref:glycosyltransferase n=1 Tax=Blautia sp. TaxID=1955243 RepID=UPI003AAC8B93
MLKAALDELWNEGYKFSLNVYFTPTELSPYMNIHGRYSYDELEAIMDETDLLICPSVWYETFGYTVLEALSFGVPVLVSDTVGAKDIIPDDCGKIFTDKEDLKNIIKSLKTSELLSWNENITKAKIAFDVKNMVESLMNLYMER